MKLNNTQATLLAARTLIANPNHFARGAFARDNQGVIVFETDPQACRWCAIGAIEFVPVGDRTRYSAMLRLEEAAKKLYGNRNPAYVNDSKGHTAVMKMYDLAIELAGKQRKR